MIFVTCKCLELVVYGQDVRLSPMPGPMVQSLMSAALIMLRFPENRLGTIPQFPKKLNLQNYLTYNKWAIQAEYSGFLEAAFDSFPENLEKYALSNCSEKITTVKNEIELSSAFFSSNVTRMKSFHGHILIFKENLWVSKYKDKVSKNKEERINGNPAQVSVQSTESIDSILILTQGASLKSLEKSFPILSRVMDKLQEYQLRVDLDDSREQYFFSLGYALQYAKDLVGVLYHEMYTSVSTKLQLFLHRKCKRFAYANYDISSECPCNEQQSNVVRCLQKEVEFIQGPPGTGACDLPEIC